MKNMNREWLETDGLGGFASGTISGRRTRRYHALLLSAVAAENARYVLVNGVEVQVQSAAGTSALSSQRFLPNVIHPHGDRLIQTFQTDPWPTWDFLLEDGTRIRQEFFVPQGFSAVVLKWSLLAPVKTPVTLSLRLLMSGRTYHALHHANNDFRFEHHGDNRRLQWNPYPGVPGTAAMTNGTYTRDPLWYYQFYYTLEAERGLDSAEDLASPGVFRFELQAAPALCILTATDEGTLTANELETTERLVDRLTKEERTRRQNFSTPLHCSAKQFLIQSGTRATIVAGYPWFTDWGRDTFIALRGLCLATGQLDHAGKILHDWSEMVSTGMLPNRFPDGKSQPEYHSVDASLWFIIAVHDYLAALQASGLIAPPAEIRQLQYAVAQILEGYSQGTRFGIRADVDGLLSAGEAGVQLTWMDAKVDDWVVTPRIGKPVEIQALWINALSIASQFDRRWRARFQQARTSFQKRFWNASQNCLYDVVDVDHQPGQMDGKIRPNQILAIGGLPLNLLERDRAARVVKTVEDRLLTPVGLRTLSPDDPDYHPHYHGDVRARDAAYHQGTVWPWLMGPFMDAWLRVNGNSSENRNTARTRFVQPLREHLQEAGLGHVSEILDAEPTDTARGLRQLPRGCPFQAWSLGELLRMEASLAQHKKL